MKPLVLLASLAWLTTASLSAQTYEQLKGDAEKFIADRSFAKANELYRTAAALPNLATNDARWARFRLSDTQWRSEASTQRSDNTKLEQARSELEKLVRDVQREEEKDRTWVEIQESLGDFWWTRRNQQNWGMAWNYYNRALDWWAGARDLHEARAHYLGIVWRVARPPTAEPYYQYGNYGNILPLPVLDNTLKIAQTDNDKAHAHYLLAMTIRNQGGSVEQRQAVPEHFAAALKAGRQTDWYDDALYNYAEWMMNQGRFTRDKYGNYQQEPDYVTALDLFRRLVNEFKKGETRYFEQAQQQIKNITDPQLGVGVGNIFLPDSEVQFSLNWRNLKRIDLALYPVDLTKDVNLTGQEERRNDWLQSIDLKGRETIKTWAKDTGDTGEYKPGGETLRYDGKLKPGAYILEARAGGKSARDIVLVTDSALVLKASGKQALLYVCNALNSAPVGNAKVRLWERYHDGKRWQTRDTIKTADKDGIAVFDLVQRAGNNSQLFAAAILNDRQSFSSGYTYWRGNESEPWHIYAYTDRPAYRPKETVNWKLIARRYNGSVYATPANQVVEFEIHDPRGVKVKEDKVSLNEFGAAWRALELTEQMPLGEYRVTFYDQGRQHTIGNATLFRLEEYKLPEFKVSVQTPEENGHKKSFRVGERIEAVIQADYYYGAPVANASVELIIYQNPYYHYWPQPREFPWFYEDLDQNPNQFRRWGGRGQVLKRETLKTDATGKATVTFDTPQDSGQDFEYQIEARVIDASRREITGNGTVRATRQRYYVHAKADHNLFRPKDKARIEFTAQDANKNPVAKEGTVSVVREYWYEIWLDPAGKEVKGDDLKRLRTQTKIWPPAPVRPDQRDWQLKFRGYEREEILSQAVKTDAEGKGELTFTPAKEGYYRVSWVSEDAVPNRLPQQIRTDTTLWVADNATTDLGYRHGGVELIVDKDTFRVGNEAPVMIVANSPDRYVLFTIEGDDLYHHRLVHLEGNNKLINIAIEERHVPNIALGAVLAADQQIFLDTKQVIVPPTKNFLTVEVKPDQSQYQPQQEGTLLVTTKNDEGKPVAAEVSLGLVDESVYYIQSDYAGDMRQFFYGTKRPLDIQTQSTFNQKSYVRLVEADNGAGLKYLIDERQRDAMLQQRRQAGRAGGSGGGGGGRGLTAEDEFDSLSQSNEYRRKDAEGFAMNMPRSEMAAAKSAAAPMGAFPGAAPASPMMESKSRFAGRAMDKAEKQSADGGEAEPAVQVRTDFRATVLWQPDVKTDKDGKASVKVKYPDSLTGWKATARAVSTGNQFGIADATTRTKQPLIVRLQAPRFFLVGDDVVLSAVVNNNTDKELTVKVALELTSATISEDIVKRLPLPQLTFDLGKNDFGAAAKAVTLKVPANGEARADWKAHVNGAGPLKLKTTAIGGKLSDGMEKEFTAYEHGIEKFLAKSGKARGNEVTVKLDIPKERKAGSTAFTVQVTPSLAVTMLDALPYLIDYPYGCTEQTMSRFLPTVVTAKTLKDLGLQPEDVMSRLFGGIESRGGATPAAPNQGVKKDLTKLNEMTAASLKRLYDFQHGDGGWGWWKEGESDHWMTAYVVWGLSLARDAGVNLKADVLERGASYLDKTLVEEEENLDMQAFVLHALAAKAAGGRVAGAVASQFQTKAFDNLWKNREKLNAYTRALLALSAHYFGNAERAKTLIENLENGVKRDDRPDQSVLVDPGSAKANASVMGTAHWGEDGLYWRWSDGGVESTAFALRALLAIDPKNKLIEPVTNWLLKSRRGAQWSNTRDTAITVLAMNDYLRVSGELKPEMEFEVFVNGKSIATKKVSGAEVFSAPSRFTVDSRLVKDGENTVRIKRKGEGSIYFAAEAKFFSLEEPIKPAGNEIFVKREYYKLVGRPTLLKGYVYDKVPLNDGESVKSGERIEAVLTIEAKNNYEYLLFEDLKAAGMETTQIRSGESLYARELKSGAVDRKFSAQPAAAGGVQAKGATKAAARRIAPSGPTRPAPAPIEDNDHTGRSRSVYQELRDRKVALFIDKLPEGVWEIRYDFRAEVPGAFHALPVLGHAMYVPEIRCNGAETRVTVVEAAQ